MVCGVDSGWISPVAYRPSRSIHSSAVHVSPKLGRGTTAPFEVDVIRSAVKCRPSAETATSVSRPANGPMSVS